MQANLTRLVDLTAELGRRLKPLGRQAEVARKAAVIQAELRDARLRLLADDYVTLAADLRRDEADEAAVLARRAALEEQVAQARARAARAGRVARLREQVGAAASRTVAAQEEMDRLEVSATEARERATLAQDEFEQMQDQAGGRDEDRSELAAAHEQAAAIVAECTERTK